MNDAVAIVNILLIATTGYISYLGFSNNQVIKRLIFHEQAILQGRQYYRLLSSAFIHGSWIHLLFNMISLYSFGQYIEIIFGWQIYIVIYFISLICGNILSLFLHRKEDYYALGASGGVSGVIFSSVFLLTGGGIYIFPIPIAIPSWLYAILFVLISVYGIQKQSGNIGHDAHLGGAISGLLVTFILFPQAIFNQFLLFVIIMIFVSAFLIWIIHSQRGIE